MVYPFEKIFFHFAHSRSDHSLFIYNNGKQRVNISYVDDIILTASSDAFRKNSISKLKTEFDMKKDLGPLSSFLGIEQPPNSKGLFLSQSKYIDEREGQHVWLQAIPKTSRHKTKAKFSDLFSDSSLSLSYFGWCITILDLYPTWHFLCSKSTNA